MSKFQTVWSDNFGQDSHLNTGLFPVSWGNGNDFSFRNNAMTLTSYASQGWSAVGFMQADSNAGSAQGYGLYSATISAIAGQGAGIALVMWPANNVWPGAEIDLTEDWNDPTRQTANATIHWKGAGNSNQYQTYQFHADLTKPTQIAMNWEQGSLTFSVNGSKVFTDTSHVPNDAAQGGVNESFGAEVTDAGAAPVSSQVSLNIYKMSYAKPIGAAAATSSAITPATTTTTAVSFAAVGSASATSPQTLYTASGTDILHGGSGVDTFNVNPATPDGWAEITGFHSGDVASILGFVSGTSTITWTTATDPNGQTGATADISLAGNGHIDSAVTFAGVSLADAQAFKSGNWHTTGGTPELNIWKV